jgi:competence protein ComEC
MPKTSLFLYSFSIFLAFLFKASINYNLNYLIIIILLFLFLNLKKHLFFKKIIASLIFIIIFILSPSYINSYINLTNQLELGRQEFSVWVCHEVNRNYYRQEIVLCFLDKNILEKVISWWPLYPNINYGDKLIINCNLALPKKLEDFDYPAFLASKGIYYTCSFPRLIKREENYKINFFKKNISSIKKNIKKLVKRNLPEPSAGLVLAMFLGERREMSEELIENFRVSGIGHLTAVSGTHINLISLFLLFIFLNFGLRKKIAYLPLIFFLGFYVLLIGAKASAIRAFLMSSFLLIAWRNNRLVHPLSVLSACAAITLMIKPKLLIDIAWQLSFTAVLGIILFMPYFNYLMEKLFKFFSYNIRKIIKPLFLAFFLSLSVQITIWPLLAWHFNYISLLSVWTNIFVFPIFSILMFLLIPTIIISYFFKILAWYLFSSIYFLTKLLIKVVEFSASFSSWYIKIDNINYLFILLYYSLVLILYRIIKKQANK